MRNDPNRTKLAHEKAMDGISECEREAKGRGTWDGKYHYKGRKYFGGWTPPVERSKPMRPLRDSE